MEFSFEALIFIAVVFLLAAFIHGSMDLDSLWWQHLCWHFPPIFKQQLY